MSSDLQSIIASPVSAYAEGLRSTGERLIELKIASGISASDQLKDPADVQELIKLKSLDGTFAKHLSEYVRPKFIERWTGVRDSRSERGE